MARSKAASGQTYIPEGTGEEPHSPQPGQKLTRAHTGKGQ